jgi:hypothetical protein
LVFAGDPSPFNGELAEIDVQNLSGEDRLFPPKLAPTD